MRSAVLEANHARLFKFAALREAGEKRSLWQQSQQLLGELADLQQALLALTAESDLLQEKATSLRGYFENPNTAVARLQQALEFSQACFSLCSSRGAEIANVEAKKKRLEADLSALEAKLLKCNTKSDLLHDRLRRDRGARAALRELAEESELDDRIACKQGCRQMEYSS